jgi:TetR/AcrR family transcriptional repressor of lmrAB and yxaGH operons
MPAPLLPREEVLDRLAAAFRRDGYDGASIARLSAATGLGKASLYHYFPGGKQDMAAAVLQHLGQRFDSLILAPLRSSAAPAERLNRMILGLNEFYERGHASCVIDLFAIGAASEPLSHRLADSLDGWIGTLAAVLQEAGQDPAAARNRAEDAVIAVQGALVVSRAGGDREPFQRTLAELPGRLLGHA